MIGPSPHVHDIHYANVTAALKILLCRHHISDELECLMIRQSVNVLNKENGTNV